MKQSYFHRILFFLIILSILGTNLSCSQLSYKNNASVKREIAQLELSKAEIADLSQEAFELNRTSETFPTGREAKKTNPKINYQEIKLHLTVIDFAENANLPKEVAYKIVPYLKNNKYHIQIQRAPGIEKDKGAYEELQHFLSFFQEGKYHKESLFFEMVYNFKKGNLYAIKDFLDFRSKFKGESGNFFKEKSSRIGYQLANENIQINIKKFYQMLGNLKETSELFKKISLNDRVGVAKLVEKNLPWNSLTPYEKAFWKKQLNIIANPLPIEQRVLAYRGVDKKSILNLNQENFKEIVEKQSFYQVANFFRTKDEINHVINYEGLKTSIVANTLKTHSLNSMRSIFISFSPDKFVARRFSSGAIGVFAMDPRSLQFNETSKITTELEFLASFFTFPDDMVAVVEVNDKEMKDRTEAANHALEKKIAEKIKNNLRAKNLDEDLYWQWRKNSKDYFSDNLENGNFKHNVFRSLLQEELVDTSQTIKKSKISAINGCVDLIKSFFSL